MSQADVAKRSDPFAIDDEDSKIDLSAFQPAAPRKPDVPLEQIRAVSDAHGFTSRVAPEPPPAPATPPPDPPPQQRFREPRQAPRPAPLLRAPAPPAPPMAELPPRRVYRTGRSVQINIKATPEVISRLHALADQHRLPLGAILERALDAFEASLTDAQRMNTIR